VTQKIYTYPAHDQRDWQGLPAALFVTQLKFVS